MRNGERSYEHYTNFLSAHCCGEEVGGLKMNARNILAKKREFMIVLYRQ